MESKSVLDNIKSDFFISIIFDITQKNIAFKIVEFNKKP